MIKQKGFTLYELLAVMIALFVLGMIGVILYTAGHFIAKFW